MELWLPLLIVPGFLAMWCGGCLVLSKLGGWSSLAERFPARFTPPGEKFIFAAARIGGVRYRGIITAIKAEDGLFLSVFKPWRFGHPPILIPWVELKNFRPQRLWGTDWVDVCVSTRRTIQLRLPSHFIRGKVQGA
jgi:hypothetical protein